MKRKCPKCKRKMCAEYETYEECTDPNCSYYVSYEGPTEEQVPVYKDDTQEYTEEETVIKSCGHDLDHLPHHIFTIGKATFNCPGYVRTESGRPLAWVK